MWCDRGVARFLLFFAFLIVPFPPLAFCRVDCILYSTLLLSVRLLDADADIDADAVTTG
jgi:hypothetical protein